MLWGVRLVNREWWYNVVSFIWKVIKTHYGDTVDRAIILSWRIRGSCKESPSCWRQGPRSFYPGALPLDLQGLLHPTGTRIRIRRGEGIVVVQSVSCVRLCDPMDCSTPDFPVLHYRPELAPTHVHWINDAIQPSRPLSPSSPPALNISQHQGLDQ